MTFMLITEIFVDHCFILKNKTKQSTNTCLNDVVRRCSQSARIITHFVLHTTHKLSTFTMSTDEAPIDMDAVGNV